MPTVLPPARSDISNTPSPSNAVAKAGLGKFWDYVTNLLGTAGTDVAARAALLAAKSGANTDITSLTGLTGPINEAHGVDIASAATINLTTATGNLVDVTGTVAITAITLADGAQRTVRFTGILTLTNGASLVLPSAANITTAAGDFAVFRGYAAGVVRCVSYTRADGRPVMAGLNFNSATQITVSTVFTQASAAGKYIYINNAGATTQTLPLASTFSSGQAIAFFNNNVGQATVVRQGPDTLYGPQGAASTSLILNQNDGVILVTDGANWLCNFFNGAKGFAPQTIQNLTASRASGTTYTNSTGRDISVFLTAVMSSGSAWTILTVDGIAINGSETQALTNNLSFVSATIPNGKTYTLSASLGTATVDRWVEYR